jgi:hypothetical protein
MCFSETHALNDQTYKTTNSFALNPNIFTTSIQSPAETHNLPGLP